jgi:hypothetical protein
MDNAEGNYDEFIWILLNWIQFWKICAQIDMDIFVSTIYGNGDYFI